ncbi:hypothetical protein HBA55_22330 [Pseudomaricurvus alkylphenolicus]|uniref:hypothetical protein n=1 Tax=Pseudomaricurvus alkylphenolicus TaxID=1306991 RepID=UPI0014227A9A|nr:hypothetical protein [Pseudomaricurvus alkylphenolicus]NIB42361.1 hypothetical protein [Pseudomaricurvus alkylphenolicus]
MNTFSALIMPVKREFWEHRALFLLLPAVLTGLLLVAMGAGLLITISGNINISISGDKLQFGERESSSNVAPTDMDSQVRILLGDDAEADRQGWEPIEQGVLGTSDGDITRGALMGVNLLFVVVAILVALYYLLGSLFNDRKDGSVLFWKSLPISETQTVLTKFVVAVFALPLVAFVAAIVSGFVYLLAAMLFVSQTGSTSIAAVWANASVIGMSLQYLLLMFVIGLWAAPIYGWLLLASAAAKRSPFMMAVIPPAVVVMIESWLLGSHRLLDSLYARVPGDVVGIKEPGFHFERYSEILFGHSSSAAFWTGLIVAGVFLAAAVWLRNNRFEI